METLLRQRDKNIIWHPCSQMKDYEKFKPLVIKKAYGSYLETTDGNKIIDAVSSWWCKSLGHAHPELKVALVSQMQEFEHVILANTTNETIIKLSEQLTKLMPKLHKVFYAGDGSCAVETALKMSLHSRIITGQKKRNKFITLANGYHGETAGALSVSDVGLYKDPYKAMLFEPFVIKNIPYVSGPKDRLWHDCGEVWQSIKTQLDKYAKEASAIIFEPLVQGAGGMKIYSKDFLHRLADWTKQHNIHLIADEIMTGFGRTGKMLASEHANIQPDFICLSKGLTSGWMPFSAVLTTDEIYDTFYDDYETNKAFLHSHTYCGNALAARIALATINIMKIDNICERANKIGEIMLENMLSIAEQSGKLKNIRAIGAIVAADLITDKPNERLGFKVYQQAVQRGALLRPLGNTIYWLPPLNTKYETLMQLKDITLQAIQNTT